MLDNYIYAQFDKKERKYKISNMDALYSCCGIGHTPCWPDFIEVLELACHLTVIIHGSYKDIHLDLPSKRHFPTT